MVSVGNPGAEAPRSSGKNLAPAIPDDTQALRYLKSERVNTLIHTLVEGGALGNKSKQGFYKEIRLPDGKKDFWVLNLKTLEYEEPTKVRFESIGKVKDEGNLGKRLKILLDADDRAGQLVRALTYQSLAYASDRVPEIADTPKPIDDAMRWGFGREAGPFETWDMIGVAEAVSAMKDAGFPPAAWVEQMLASGHASFNIHLDISVPVSQTIPVVLDVPVHMEVPVDIPLNETELHEAFVGLRTTVEPYHFLFQNLPASWEESPFCGPLTGWLCDWFLISR